MRAGLGVSVGGYVQVWADMGKGGQVWIGRTDQAGMDDMGSGLVWTSLGRYGQRWSKVGRSGWVRLGWVTWVQLVGVDMCAGLGVGVFGCTV